MEYSKPVYVVEDPVWYNFSKPSFSPKEKIEILLYESNDFYSGQRNLYIEKTINEIFKTSIQCKHNINVRDRF